MQTINLQSNQLPSISSGAFGGLSRLVTVELSNNLLTEVPSASFTGAFGDIQAQGTDEIQV